MLIHSKTLKLENKIEKIFKSIKNFSEFFLSKIKTSINLFITINKLIKQKKTSTKQIKKKYVSES